MIRLIRTLLFTGVILAGLAGWLARPAYAAGVVGDGTPASCTEAALTTALAGGGSVSFNCGGPITILVLSEKTISQNTIIQGGGVITLTGGLATRLFRVNSPASLTLNGIILDSAFGVGSDGGAIANSGTLRLENSTIQYSQTDNGHSGGAIFSTGPVFISNSTLRNNTGGSGGAIFINFANAAAQISNSTFNNNKTTNTTTGYGGAIWVGTQANLTVTDSSFLGNSAQDGGALYVTEGGSVTLRTLNTANPTYFLINSATQDGGAVYSLGSLSVYGAQFNGNSTPKDMAALGYGGGIASLGPLTLYDSLLTVNQGRFGGGLFVGGGAGTARADIQRTVFSQNEAGSMGGGLYTNVETTVISVTNSVFRRNSAISGGGLARFSAQLTLTDSSLTQNTAISGGGLYVSAGPAVSTGGYVKVRSVTISGNEATGSQGGGVFNRGLLELYFTTIASNTTGVYSMGGGNTRFRSSVLYHPGVLNCDGDGSAQISNDAANHVSDASCGPTFPAAGDPKLGPLQSDGLYTTSYHLPLAGSPLINAGYSPCPPRDQRGALRPDACDIGAVEYGGVLQSATYLPLVVK